LTLWPNLNILCLHPLLEHPPPSFPRSSAPHADPDREGGRLRKGDLFGPGKGFRQTPRMTRIDSPLDPTVY